MRPQLIATVLCLASGILSSSILTAGSRGKLLEAPGPIKNIRPCNLPYDDQTKAIICTNRSVPPNWVIVGLRHSPGCNGLSNNSWVIQRLPNYPGAEIVICSSQPIPPGWGVVEVVKSCYCGHGQGGIRIRKM